MTTDLGKWVLLVDNGVYSFAVLLAHPQPFQTTTIAPAAMEKMYMMLYIVSPLYSVGAIVSQRDGDSWKILQGTFSVTHPSATTPHPDTIFPPPTKEQPYRLQILLFIHPAAMQKSNKCIDKGATHRRFRQRLQFYCSISEIGQYVSFIKDKFN